jgi:hypothetical protein
MASSKPSGYLPPSMTLSMSALFAQKVLCLLSVPEMLPIHIDKAIKGHREFSAYGRACREFI